MYLNAKKKSKNQIKRFIFKVIKNENKKHPVTYLACFLLLLNWTYADLNTYYVKFSSSPFTSSIDHIESQHSSFHNELKKRGTDVKIGHIFKRYANGISIG